MHSCEEEELKDGIKLVRLRGKRRKRENIISNGTTEEDEKTTLKNDASKKKKQTEQEKLEKTLNNKDETERGGESSKSTKKGGEGEKIVTEQNSKSLESVEWSLDFSGKRSCTHGPQLAGLNFTALQSSNGGQG